MSVFLIVLIIIAVIVVPAGVMAAIGYASIQALGRNPSAAPKILLAMLMNLIFVEALAIIAILVIFQLFAQT